ncbi:MAG: hypothetical protein CL609_17645 [Anaerolineaceae bacterium]|nr:hypothetical protein [Anaerolineaceae bacterium]
MLHQLTALSDSKRLRLLMVLFLALYVSWILWGSDQPLEQIWIGQFTLLFTSAYSLYLAWTKEQSNTNPAFTKTWGWIRNAFLVWLFYDLFFIFGTLNLLPFSAVYITSGLFLIGSVCLWIGLFRSPIQIRSVYGKTRLLLDTTLTSAALITLMWLAFYKSFLNITSFEQALWFSFITADLITILIFINLFLWGDIKQEFTNIGWMIFGFVAFFFSDWGFLSQNVITPYRLGSFMDMGWVFGGLFFIFVLQNPNLFQDPELNGFWGKSLPRVQSLLPILAVIVLGWYALLNWQLMGTVEIVGLWITLALGLGLLVRQGLVAGEINLARYAQLVNSIAEPAFICDSSGFLMMVNPALLEIGGYHKQDVLGFPLGKIFQFREQEDTWWMQILHDKNDNKFMGSEREVNLIRKNNEIIPVMLSLRPVQSENLQYLAIAGTAHDLRIQKLQQSEIQSAYDEVAQAQDALRRLNAGLEQLVNEKTADLQKAYQQLEEQNKQLQQLDQIKSDFVSLVSHELRAPLTNIRGGIELLLSGYIQDPNRVNSTLSQVQAEILRLSQFTETILDLSALDANRLPLYLEPLNLTTVVYSLRQHYQHSQQAERIIWDVSVDTPPILADEKALHSILFHILDNALKYAPAGEITLSAVPEANQLLISVSDHGPGIPQEALPFLFDRFYRVNMADAQTIYGHGLGLYMVRRFTEAMHGSVSVKNNPQGGAEFMIRLPIVT